MRPIVEVLPEGTSVAMLTGALPSHTVRLDDAPDFYRSGAGALVASAPAVRLEVGARVAGRYRIERELGRGGFGVVYEAFDESPLQRSVALKVMRVAAGGGEQAQRLRRQLLDEARLAGGLSHPHVATVYDLGDADGALFMTQELVRGRDLRSIIEADGILAVRRALELARQICEGVAAAHDKGIVHRDLKPANVLVAAGDHVKITDFGLAQAALGEGDSGGVVVGTPGYMSPEQMLGKPVDLRSDVFAFGCVLYHMLTGRPPFSGRTLAAIAEDTIHSQPIPPSRARPDLPPGLEHIIQRCLKKAAGDRYPSMRAVLEDLSRPARLNPLADASVAATDLLSGGTDGWAVMVGDHLWVGDAEGGRGSVESLLCDHLATHVSTLVTGERLRNLAQTLQAEVGRDAMVRRVAQASGSRQLLADPVASRLAEMPVPLVVTTRYDNGLASAMCPSKTQPTSVVYGCELDAGVPQERLLVHLFGNREQPDSLVVTEDDLWDFYGVAHQRASALREALGRRRLLLVGFDPSDEVFQQICLHVAQCGAQRAAPVYLVTESVTATSLEWAERRGIQVVQEDAARFLERVADNAARAPESVEGWRVRSGASGLVSGLSSLRSLGQEAQRTSAAAPTGLFLRAALGVALLLLTLGGWARAYFGQRDAEPPALQAALAPDALIVVQEQDQLELVQPAVPPVEQSPSFVLALAPFWGMNQAALEEGRLMQVLAEREVREAVGDEPAVRILAKEVTQVVRSHVEARALAATLDADAVLWGEVLILGDTLEIQPYLTRRNDELQIRDEAAPPLQVGLNGTDQLKMRKVSAEQLGTMGLFVAGQYFALHDPARALELFRKVSPSTADSLAWQGEAVLRQGRFAQAEELMGRALALDPDNVFALSRLGWLNYYDGRISQALAFFERSVQLDSANAYCHLNFGVLLSFQGQHERALNAFRTARDLDPGAEPVVRALLNAYLRESRFEEALAAAEAVRGERDGERLWMDMTAFVLARQGKEDEATSLLKRARELYPDSEDIETAMAWSLFNAEHIDDAKTRFSELLKRNPENLAATFGLAVTLEFLGELEESLRYMERAQAISPWDYRTYHAMARVQGKLGKLDEAAKTLRDSLRRAPPPSFLPSLHVSLGEVQNSLGNHEEAIAEFRLALSQQPTVGVPYMYLGALLEEQDRLEEAAAVYAEAGSKIDLYLGRYTPLFVYVTEARLGRPDALTRLERAAAAPNLAIDKGWPFAVYTYLLGGMDEASLLSAARHAGGEGPVASLPEQEAWHYIGMNKRIQGQAAEAEVWLRKIVEEGTQSTFESRVAKAELKRFAKLD